MKKIIAVSILAAVAAMMISCDKSEFQQPETSASKFTGSIDNVATKTVLTDADKLNWESSDEISINGVTFVAVPDADDPSTAVFDKKAGNDPELVSGKYNAYYPASLLVDGVPTLPVVQTYSATSLAGVNPMYAQSGDKNLAFKNICGLLEISLKGTKTITEIDVYADNLGLSGEFTVDENFNAVVDNANGVALYCGEDGVKLNSRTATKFYIAVPAGTYENLTFMVFTADGYVAVTSAETATVKRNVIYAIAPQLEYISLDYLAFTGSFAYPAIDYFEDYAETVGLMEVYPLEYNKTFALFFPGATPEYEGETYDYFIATYDSRTKTMSLSNNTGSEEGAIWGFQGIDGYCQMSMDFGYWVDEETVASSLDFVTDADNNLLFTCNPASTEDEDFVYIEASILSEAGEQTGYATSVLIVDGDTFYNVENLDIEEEKPQSKDIVSKIARKPVAGKGFTPKTSRVIEKGTGAYLMK